MVWPPPPLGRAVVVFDEFLFGLFLFLFFLEDVAVAGGDWYTVVIPNWDAAGV